MSEELERLQAEVEFLRSELKDARMNNYWDDLQAQVRICIDTRIERDELREELRHMLSADMRGDPHVK